MQLGKSLDVEKVRQALEIFGNHNVDPDAASRLMLEAFTSGDDMAFEAFQKLSLTRTHSKQDILHALWGKKQEERSESSDNGYDADH